MEQQRKGRNKNTIIDYNYISSNRYRKKFDYISNDKKLNKLLYKIAKKMLLHRSGTEYEDMYWIDLINGKIVCKITDSKYKKKILYTTTIKKMIKKSENLLTIHTHPDSFPPSIDDINSNYDHNYEIGIVICHDGRVYMYSAEERINVNYYGRQDTLALVLASQKNDYKLCKLLVSKGAKINVYDGRKCESPLYWAVRHNNYKLAKLTKDE